jgi:hypothetical protein
MKMEDDDDVALDELQGLAKNPTKSWHIDDVEKIAEEVNLSGKTSCHVNPTTFASGSPPDVLDFFPKRPPRGSMRIDRNVANVFGPPSEKMVENTRGPPIDPADVCSESNARLVHCPKCKFPQFPFLQPRGTDFHDVPVVQGLHMIKCKKCGFVIDTCLGVDCTQQQQQKCESHDPPLSESPKLSSIKPVIPPPFQVASAFQYTKELQNPSNNLKEHQKIDLEFLSEIIVNADTDVVRCTGCSREHRIAKRKRSKCWRCDCGMHHQWCKHGYKSEYTKTVDTYYIMYDCFECKKYETIIKKPTSTEEFNCPCGQLLIPLQDSNVTGSTVTCVGCNISYHYSTLLKEYHTDDPDSAGCNICKTIETLAQSLAINVATPKEEKEEVCEKVISTEEFERDVIKLAALMKSFDVKESPPHCPVCKVPMVKGHCMWIYSDGEWKSASATRHVEPSLLRCMSCGLHATKICMPKDSYAVAI